MSSPAFKINWPSIISLPRLGLLFLSLTAATDATAAPTLTARELVSAAIEAHPDFETFSARLEAAGARTRARAAERLPHLGVEAGTQHFNDPLRIRPAFTNNQAGEFARNLWSGDVVLRWTAYSGGRLSAAEEAARLLEEAADADLRFFQERIATRVAQLYFEFSARKAIIRASEKSLQSLREQAHQVNRLLEQGKAAEVDRMRLEVRAATVEQSLIQQRNERSGLRATINFMVGRSLEEVWESVALVEEASSAAAPAADGGSGVSGIRSDLQAARLRMESAAATIDETEAAWLPQVQLFTSYGRRGDWSGREDYDRSLVGLQLSLDIWDAGTRRAKVSEARANTKARAAELDSLSESRRLDLKIARDNFTAALERLQVAVLSAETAAESLRIEQSKYSQGKGTIIDVLDAETAALEAESLFIRAQADVKISRAAVDFARGAALSPSAACGSLRP
jgi:outer membrane protein